jgi:beta-glucanase (GH16 family)
MYPWAAGGTTQVLGAARLDGQGNLELVTRNMSEAAGLWTKGKVEVKPPFTATATVKWPNSVEMWHGFWWDGSGWPIHGELDFYETGNVAYFEPHWYQGCAHEWNGSTHVSKRCQRIVPGFDPTASFHRYGARVTNTSITYLLDGNPVGVAYPLTSAWQQAGHFIFTLWPNHAGYTAPTGFPATMKVARVEVTVP